MYRTFFYILLLLPLLSTTSSNSVTIQDKNSLNIVSMVNDYTLVNKVSEPFKNINTEANTFCLNGFKEKEIQNNKIKDIKKENEKRRINKKNVLNIVNDWFSYFDFDLELELKTERFLELDPFEQRVQNHVDSLNRVIINASDGLLNMCDKMIAKTTSSLPLSYSSYSKFETEMRSKDNDVEDESDDSNSGFFSFFSSKTDSTKNKALVVSSVKDKEEIEAQVVQQMYDYQVYRQALNNRQSFLNGLCFNTFGDPYTLYYNSDNNTLSVIYNPAFLNYYTIVVQNIIDNSFIRNLNRGFKSQQKGKDKTTDKEDFNFDVEFDIDKDKKEILVEKAKYILPILQRLEQRLPTYFIDIAKRSLNIDEYFQNLRLFWSNILDESVIASNDSPLTFKKDLEVLRLKEAAVLAEKEKMLKAEKDKMFKAEQEAQRIRDEYRKKSLIEEARDFVRQSELLFKEKQQNFSNQEWQQFNAWFSHQLTKGVNIYDSVLSGVGQMLHSTLSIPANVVLGFASTQVSEIGKLLILIAGVVIVGLMTLFFVKLFMRRFIRLFWNTEKM
jgi:hypothetical protein